MNQRYGNDAMTVVGIQRIATATPPHDVHEAFIEYSSGMLRDRHARSILKRMAQRAGIDHRYSYIQAKMAESSGSLAERNLFRSGKFPTSKERMKLFEEFAPRLLRCVLDRLALNTAERSSIKHLIVTCCTGLSAPGLDFTVIEYLDLDPAIERTMVSFMGCYAAINGLKLARHIVRSEPESSVLMINLELCSLHFQETQNLESVLSFLLFGDGCAASLIRADDHGLAVDGFRAITIPGTRDLIRWSIGDAGFDMELSGRVPGELRLMLREAAMQINPDHNVVLWAIHPGGRSILDAVQTGLQLQADELAVSRSILRRFGNMSSATVMFVLEELMRTAQPGERGCAMSFGPGLTAETMAFHVF